MIVSRALKTQNLKSGFSKLLSELEVANKGIMALMTPHFSHETMTDSLQSLSKHNIIGGVVDGIQGYNGPCISLTTVDKAIPFLIPDGVFQSRDKAVGRWASMQKDYDRMRSGGFDGVDELIKGSLHDLNSKWLSDMEQKVGSFLFLSEKSSLHEFCQLLDTGYPNSAKIGIQTSPMFFNTGYPSFLFSNSQVLTGGVVGFGLPSKKKVSMDFLDLVPFSNTLLIDDCRGNVLLGWEGSSGSSVSFKDLRGSLYVQLMDYNMNSVYQVIGGDPSKQNIVLDTENELKKGMKFRFMIKDGNSNVSFPKEFEVSCMVNNQSSTDENGLFSFGDGPLSVTTNEGGIIGGSSGPCVISSIPNSIVYF